MDHGIPNSLADRFSSKTHHNWSKLFLETSYKPSIIANPLLYQPLGPHIFKGILWDEGAELDPCM